MRRMFIDMQTNLKQCQESVLKLTDEVRSLKNENIKLTSDITVIRREHNEMAESVYNIETMQL